MNNNLIGGPDSLTYKVPAQTYVAGNALTFPNWIPARGPNGGRVVIDAIDLFVNVTDYNVATTAVNGADQGRWFKRITVEKTNGTKRINGVRGDALRQFNWHHAGENQEAASSAVANDQTLKHSLRLWMAKPSYLEPFDFSLPADLFRSLVVECADVAELGVGGGTVTIDGATYYAVAHCHEEYAVVIHIDDVLTESPLKATSGDTLMVGGRLHDLLFYARGASGGAAMANMTDVLIDELMPQALLSNPDLVDRWQAARNSFHNLAATPGSQVRGDPAGAGRCVPVIFTTARTSVFDGKLVDAVTARLTNSVASVIAVHRNVLPRSQQDAAATMSKYGVSGSDFRVKTKGKTKRDPGEWAAELRAFLPVSAPLSSNRVR